MAQLSSGSRQSLSIDLKGTISNSRPRSDKRNSVVSSSVASPNEDIRRIEKAVFDLMNAERASKGLSGLKWSDDIASAARLHSVNMASQNFFSHKGKDGSMVDDRADRFGIGWNAIGENIAFLRGYSDPEKKALKTWLDSPPHRRNILSPQWQESAIGVALADDGSYYFTQVFITRK